jgi:pyruvate kinase
MKKTKIICTVGPSTDEEEILTKIIDEGMDIARLNFSHGSYKEHEKRLELLNKIALEKNTYIATIADTKGPEMRLGEFVNGGVMLEPNSQFCITIENVLGNENIASVNYANLVEDLHIGNRILLSDGLLELVVEKIQGTKIYTKVIHGGYISSRKRLAVPGIELKLPFLSKEDEKDILFAIEHKMDYIAASFTQNVENVFDIKRILEAHNSNIGIIAKIENHEGVKNIDSLLDVVDGVMVARGDLGVEIDAEMVPIVQKEIIKKCNEAGIFVITATQMLESMTNNYRATRAEASDVANSIFDGTDAIMLSGETASGKYPVEAVRTMAKIAITTEKALNYLNIFQSKGLNNQ